MALAAGCLLFVPWVPTFLYQASTRGRRGPPTPNFSDLINALTGFTDNQGSTLQTGTNQGRLLAVIYFAMLALAVFGVGRSGRIIELDLRTRPRVAQPRLRRAGRRCSPPSPAGSSPASAFSARYAAVVFLPFLLLVALGTTTLLNPRARVVVVGLAVVAGLVSSAQNVTTQRTQAGAVAAAINAQAKPGDVIAFCPDQLGPSVYRQIHDPSQYDMVTFPRRTGPAHRRLGRLRRCRARATPAPSPPTWPSGPGRTTTSGWSGSRCTRTTASSASRSPTDLQNAATKNGGDGRNVVTSHAAALLRADEPERVRHLGILTAGSSRPG